MENDSMQTIKSLIELMMQTNSHSDAFKIIENLELQMDDLHDYSFKLLPGAQLSYEVDTVSSIPPHVHRFYEILFVTQGKQIEYILDSKRYQLEQGSILFIPAGSVHHPLLGQSNKSAYKRYTLWFEAEFFDSICSKFPSVGYVFEQCVQKDDYLLQCTDSELPELLEILNGLRREMKNQQFGWEAQVAIGAVSVMNHLSRAYHSHDLTSVRPVRNTKLDDALDYINRHFHEQLTAEGLAQKIFVSKSTLNQLFQKNLGTSIYQYILRRKLLQAKILILQGESMGTICEKCGFSDYATFYRAFKKMFGMTPNEYKATYLT